MPRARLLGAPLLAFLLALGVLAVTAAACEGGGSGGKELTSLSTTLSGEGKEGEEITVAEGAKVKDKATLTGKNASKATGKVKYKIYSEKECKTLVKEAGEVTVSGESVPASSEEELEAGKSYYWQAHYGGDEKNDESTSPCTEILKVKAKTSLSTKLSGGGEEDEEITVNEGTKVKDKATLTGTNSSSAEGKVLYKIYSDKECKTLVKEAGEEAVSSGSVPASSEEELEGGKTYYWQATYKGDGLHKESTSSCGSEVLKVKAKTTLATTLSGGGEEGDEISVNEGTKAKDKATVEGTNASSAEGKVLYKVYSDSKCEHLVAEAGEKSVSSRAGTASNEEELEGAAVYYWQATYKGDSLHQESKSSCGKEVLTVKAKTTLSTTLSGEGKEGVELTAPEGLKIKDDATLGGSHSSSADGKLLYKIYSDKECKDLVTSAGEETVSSGSVPASSEEELEGGKTYYWQATYKGDSLHQESMSECGSELLSVKLPPAPPETSCPITSEGVKLRRAVTSSNEAALREEFINSTWIPVGDTEGECKEVIEFATYYDEITIAEREEYEQHIDELITPGAYVYAFKWHKTGGSTFETLGVTNATNAVEFEPIGSWYIGRSSEEEKPEENEIKGGVEHRKKIWPWEVWNGFGWTAASGTVELLLTTPNNSDVENQATNLTAKNDLWLFSVDVSVTKENVANEPGGLQCYESKVRRKVDSGLGFVWAIGAHLGSTSIRETIYKLCADGA